MSVVFTGEQQLYMAAKKVTIELPKHRTFAVLWPVFGVFFQSANHGSRLDPFGTFSYCQDFCFTKTANSGSPVHFFQICDLKGV